MARSPELARLFQQPDLENHWVPMRNRALPSVMVQGQERTERWPDQERTSILNRFARRGGGLTQNDIASFVGCSQSLVSPDRLADGHKSFIPKPLDRVP